jgi:hypothetical protein
MEARSQRHTIRIALFDIGERLRDVRRRIWNKRIKLAWYRLWVRRNEFHPSLNTDFNAMFVMDKKEQEEYRADLMRRRDIAHRRDLARADKRYARSEPA